LRLACFPAVLLATLLAAAPDASPEDVAFAEHESAAEVGPGWNLFSEKDDIQLGKEAAAALEAEVELAQDAIIDRYLVRLGDRLRRGWPDANSPFSFKIIAASSLHAFAFPGGPVYLTAGMMATARSEAQLAGLIAHQLAHIVLRHATGMASRKARFRVRAALAASSTAEVTLLESLRAIGLTRGSWRGAS
jgi:predicted Zn-dependent protease